MDIRRSACKNADRPSQILCDIPNGSALSISGFSNGWVHLSDLYIEYVI